jgi:ankyrin repeat protein
MEEFFYAFPGYLSHGENKFASALHSIAATHDFARFTAILPHLISHINEPVARGQYLLHLLIDAGMPEAVWALVGVPELNPNNGSRSYPHPLHYLVARKCATKEWAEALLALPGLDVNARNAHAKQKGHTPLSAAVVAQEFQLVEALAKDARCRLDLPNGLGQTPLVLAIPTSPKIVDLLLAAGAEVNAPGTDGETALMRALESGATEIAERLIAAGADAKMWYHRGKLPAHISQTDDGLPSFPDEKK